MSSMPKGDDLNEDTEQGQFEGLPTEKEYIRNQIPKSASISQNKNIIRNKKPLQNGLSKHSKTNSMSLGKNAIIASEIIEPENEKQKLNNLGLEHEEEKGGCVLSPVAKVPRTSRGFKTFNHDQAKKKKMEIFTSPKTEKKKTELQKASSPSLNSSLLSPKKNQKNDGTIFTRLHENKKKNIGKELTIEDPNATFHPKLCNDNIKLQTPATTKHKYQKIELEPTQTVTSPTKCMSPLSPTILKKKYDTELQELLKKYDHNNLNYSELTETFKEFKLRANKPNTKETSLASLIWDTLKGEERTSISKDSIIKFILAIACPQKEKVKAKVNQTQEIRKSIGMFNEDGEYSLTFDESYMLFKKYSHRLMWPNSNPQKISHKHVSSFSFSPYVSPHSSALADAARTKTLSNCPLDEEAKQFEILLHRKTLFKKIPEGKNEAKECTFRPKINSQSSSRQCSPHGNIERKENRFDELYKMSKKIKKSNKPVEESLLESSKEYTFHPQINHLLIKPNIDKIPGVENCIKRTIDARKERETVKIMQKRGYDCFNQDSKMKKIISQKTIIDRTEEKVNKFLSNRKYSHANNSELKKCATARKEIPKSETPKYYEKEELEEIKEFRTEDQEKSRLFIELNLGPGITEKVLMCENDDPAEIVELIGKNRGLNEAAKVKLTEVIKSELEKLRHNQY